MSEVAAVLAKAVLELPVGWLATNPSLPAVRRALRETSALLTEELGVAGIDTDSLPYTVREAVMDVHRAAAGVDPRGGSLRMQAIGVSGGLSKALALDVMGAFAPVGG